MSDVRVRDAIAADAAALAPLVVALNEHLGWAGSAFDEQSFLRDGVGPDRWFETLVADAGTGLVGYAMFHRSYDTEVPARGSYLTDLYVVPEARRSGVGRRLLAGVAARTQEWGGDVVWWATTEANEVGRAFYRRLARHVPGVEIWVAAAEDFDDLIASVGDECPA